jgi:Zn-dependent alcohol dehydrogenase
LKVFGRTLAVVDLEYGQPLAIEEVELPDPGPRQVVVKQFATGICHSQLHRLRNPSQKRPEFLGHESTGVVVARGPGVDYVAEGDHVMVTWVPRNAYRGMPRHNTAMIGFRGELLPAAASSHTWMQTVICDERWVVKIDKDVPTDVTSVVGCAVLTGAGAALHTAHVTTGSTVAVFGAGGLGLCTIQACANVSAYPIIVVDLVDEKLDYARQFGATHTVNASREDPVARIKELTGGGADFAFDMIGASETIAQLMPSVRSGELGSDDGGTGVLVGFPAQNPGIPAREIFGGAKKFMSTAGGSGHPERDFPLFLSWYQQGKLPLDKLVTRRYRLEQINEACADLQHGLVLGRAIVEF